ncbi:MAG: hypothetical protein ACYSU0_12335, partial [Planctomycetota bacterium]
MFTDLRPVADVRLVSVLSMNVAILHVLLYIIVAVHMESYVYFLMASLLLLADLVWSLWLFSGNIVIVLRYLALWVPVFATSAVWWLFEGEVKTGAHGPQYQTFASTSVLVFGASLAVCGSVWGWAFALRNRAPLPQDRPLADLRTNLTATVASLRWPAVAGMVLFAAAVVYAHAGIVTPEKPYGAGNWQLPIPLKINGLMMNLFAALLLMHVGMGLPGKWVNAALVCVAVGLPLLTGCRAEFILTIFVLALILLKRLWSA